MASRHPPALPARGAARRRLTARLARPLVALAAVVLVAPGAAEAAPAAPGEVREEAASIARAWVPKIAPDGSIAEPLPIDPAPFPDGYGELMLAEVLLRDARDRGDATSGRAAAALVRARGASSVPSDPFNLLAGAGIGRLAAPAGAPVPGYDADLAQWLGAYGPFRDEGRGGACLATPGCYTNWRLVWAAGAADLLATGLAGAPGSLLADPAGTRAAIQANVALAAAQAGPRRSTPGGVARISSDPSGRPTAYHLLSAYLLERLAAAEPGLETPAARELREQTATYALHLMAPDGQLTWSGRSLEQSWVMAAAAALGARNAAKGGAAAPRWRRFADLAYERLRARHGRLADGAVAIVPALHRKLTRSVIDDYAGVVQYNGLTAWLLADAAEHWPVAAAPRRAIPSESGLLLADRGGSDLVWGRGGNLFWSYGVTDGGIDDARFDQGLVLAKRARGRAWSDRIALRPLNGPSTAWKVTRSGRQASFRFAGVSGSGRHAVLRGRWVRGGKTLRPARITVRVRGDRLEASTAVHRGERLVLTVWAPRTSGMVGARGPKAKITRRDCRLSASGRACARELSFTGAGTATVIIR